MERLTFVDEEGRGLFTPKGCSQDIGYTIIQLMEDGHVDLLEEIAERLANCEQRLKGYEDIGLTPKQLMEVDKLYAEKCKELAESEKRSFSGLEMVKIWAKLKKLKEYQKLEEQGKLLKLPCAVGIRCIAFIADIQNVLKAIRSLTNIAVKVVKQKNVTAKKNIMHRSKKRIVLTGL